MKRILQQLDEDPEPWGPFIYVFVIVAAFFIAYQVSVIVYP